MINNSQAQRKRIPSITWCQWWHGNIHRQHFTHATCTTEAKARELWCAFQEERCIIHTHPTVLPPLPLLSYISGFCSCVLCLCIQEARWLNVKKPDTSYSQNTVKIHWRKRWERAKKKKKGQTDNCIVVQIYEKPGSSPVQDSRERLQKDSKEVGGKKERERLGQHQQRLPNMNGVRSILTHPHSRKISKA